MSELGSTLRARRTSKGLTLQQVADAADLSVAYVSNLERGRGNPTLDALSAIAAALNASVQELVGEVTPGADVALSTAPNSLLRFTRTELFKQEIALIAERIGKPEDQVREEFVHGLASAPRRSKGEPTEDDWKHLFRTFKTLLSE